MEQLLFAIRDYFNPPSADFIQTVVREGLVYGQELQEFEQYAHMAAAYADLANWEMATVKYDKALC